MSKINQYYTEYYNRERNENECLWPTEFLVRALLGQTYGFNTSKIYNPALDIGFGDGRNLPLLNSC